MLDAREAFNAALDSIGLLVPAARVVALILGLAEQAKSAAAEIAQACVQLHDELQSVVDDMKLAPIDVNQALREGFPAEVIRETLRDAVRRLLERNHPNTPADADLVAREVDQLMGEQFDRQLAWACVPIEKTLKPVLLPLIPLLALLERWKDEIEASSETSDAAHLDYRRLGITVLGSLLDSMVGEVVTLAQAARETGLSPDELLEAIRMGHLFVDGDARSPRLERAQVFTLQFRQLARHRHEAER